MGRFECLKGAVFDFVTVRGWFFFLMKIGLVVLCLVMN